MDLGTTLREQSDEETEWEFRLGWSKLMGAIEQMIELICGFAITYTDGLHLLVVEMTRCRLVW